MSLESLTDTELDELLRSTTVGSIGSKLIHDEIIVRRPSVRLVWHFKDCGDGPMQEVEFNVHSGWQNPHIEGPVISVSPNGHNLWLMTPSSWADFKDLIDSGFRDEGHAPATQRVLRGDQLYPLLYGPMPVVQGSMDHLWNVLRAAGKSVTDWENTELVLHTKVEEG